MGTISYKDVINYFLISLGNKMWWFSTFPRHHNSTAEKRVLCNRPAFNMSVLVFVSLFVYNEISNGFNGICFHTYFYHIWKLKPKIFVTMSIIMILNITIWCSCFSRDCKISTLLVHSKQTFICLFYITRSLAYFKCHKL